MAQADPGRVSGFPQYRQDPPLMQTSMWIVSNQSPENGHNFETLKIIFFSYWFNGETVCAVEVFLGNEFEVNTFEVKLK